MFDVGKKSTDWIHLFYNEILEDEAEEKADFETMIARAVRFAFHADNKAFENYNEEFEKFKNDLKIMRLIESGYKFNGTVKNQRKK